MGQILLLHGPNLNLLGQREPATYGHDTLATINTRCLHIAAEAGHSFSTLQANAEHLLIERIQLCAQDGTDFIVFNPAAFTHTSIALRDALLAVQVPFIEVHLSNPAARESFRQHSYFSDIALGVIAGFGALSYELAMRAACARLVS